MAAPSFANFATTTITNAVLNPLDTVINLSPGSGTLFPVLGAVGAWFPLILVDSLTAPTKREVLRCVVHVGTSDQVEVIRGQEGTIAQSWVAGNFISLRITAQALLEARQDINAALLQGRDWFNPDIIGAATPNDAIFNNVQINTSLVGLGVNALFASPPPIGSVAPNTGKFTDLEASGNVTGAGITARFSAPGPIGDIVPNTGNFTNILATGRIGLGSAAVLQYEAAYGAAGNKSVFACSNTPGEAAQGLAQFSNTNGGSSVNFIKGRGAANAGVIVQNGDTLGGVYWYGTASAAALGLAASILAQVDGVPGAVSDMPGRLVFSLTPDGSGVAAEVLRLSSNKVAQFAGNVKGTAGAGTAQPAFTGMLSVNVTPTGNVGAGVDTLMSYVLPANSLSADGKGIRVTAWGYAAANANPKRLVIMFGATPVATLDLLINETLYWKASALIFRYAPSVQSYYGEIDYRTASVGRALEPAIEMGGAAEDETTAITVSLTGSATSNDDIVQKGMLIEFVN